MRTFERQELAQILGDLPIAQFEQILFALEIPSRILPARTAPQGERAAVFLNWAETTGPGLATIQELVYGILGKEPPSQASICPYKGLSYFDCNDEDYKYFYGREALIQTLLERISEENFLAVVGASGSGKSSVLRAGLLQRLKNQDGYEIRILVPGEHPLRSLGLTFVDEKSERTERAKQLQNIEDLLQRGADGLSWLVRTSNARQVVLVVDQFEESFTLCQDKAERQAFFEALLGGLEVTSPKLCLILAMRSDFIGKCFEQDNRRLALKVQRHLESVLPMTLNELTQAIIEPARQTGSTLEPGLMEALLADLKPSPGGLPLLQYTLTELWQQQSDNQLKLSTYVQLGGVTGALEQRADELYDSLTLDQKKIAKHIFLSLTHLGEGAEDTRRHILQDNLYSSQYGEHQVTRVIKKLADANLLVTDKRGKSFEDKHTAIVDVAHEALIRNWPKLRHWLDENRELLRQQRKIELAAEEWNRQSNDRHTDYLLQGRQLANAHIFLKKHGQDYPLSQIADSFLSQSLICKRRKFIKLVAIAVTIPMGLVAYTGIQAATYFKLRPHWQIVHSHYAGSDQITDSQLALSLQAINSERRSLNKTALHAANLGEIYLSDAKLREANLSSANLREADLSGAYLRSADLSDARLRDAYLRDADLGDAYLRDADLRNVNLRDTFLRGADLSNANLSGGSDLRNADLRNATLIRATLSDTDLRNADLSNANLSGADLSDANLSGTNLSGVNLSDTDLSGANLHTARLCRTILPEGIILATNRNCSEQDIAAGVADSNHELITESYEASFEILRTHTTIQQRLEAFYGSDSSPSGPDL